MAPLDFTDVFFDPVAQMLSETSHFVVLKKIYSLFLQTLLSQCLWAKYFFWASVCYMKLCHNLPAMTNLQAHLPGLRFHTLKFGLIQQKTKDV